MTRSADTAQLLDTAELLFYERGYQAVGMDEIRTTSGLPLKRIYSLFKGKDALALAMLDRRDERWHTSLSTHVDLETDPTKRVIAVFGWLSVWLSEDGHRGCAWVNAFGELGGTSATFVNAAREHKAKFRNYLEHLVQGTGASRTIADAIFLLAEGCMVTAGIDGNTKAVAQAQQTAILLLDNSFPSRATEI